MFKKNWNIPIKFAWVYYIEYISKLISVCCTFFYVYHLTMKQIDHICYSLAVNNFLYCEQIKQNNWTASSFTWGAAGRLIKDNRWMTLVPLNVCDSACCTDGNTSVYLHWKCCFSPSCFLSIFGYNWKIKTEMKKNKIK